MRELKKACGVSEDRSRKKSNYFLPLSKHAQYIK